MAWCMLLQALDAAQIKLDPSFAGPCAQMAHGSQQNSSPLKLYQPGTWHALSNYFRIAMQFARHTDPCSPLAIHTIQRIRPHVLLPDPRSGSWPRLDMESSRYWTGPIQVAIAPRIYTLTYHGVFCSCDMARNSYQSLPSGECFVQQGDNTRTFLGSPKSGFQLQEGLGPSWDTSVCVSR